MTTIVDGTLGVTFPAGGVGNPASAVVGLTDTQTLTNKTLTTPTISSLSSAAATALTLQSAGATAITVDTSQNVGVGTTSFSARLTANLDNSTAYANTAPNIANCTAAFTNASGHTAGGTFVGYQLNISGNSQNRIGYFGAISDSTSNQGLGLVFGTNTTAGDRSEKMRIDSSGNLLVGTATAAGKLTVKASGTENVGNQIANFTSATSGDGVFFFLSNGTAHGSASLPTIAVNKNTATGRSINAEGTINASGADYAEYMTKAGEFIVAKGDVVGIDAQGKLTNVFANAVSFVVKSTDPSYVGGDSWASEDVIGKRPKPDAPQDEIDNFNVALEAVRALVDRIAFAGQVPVNVIGATAGQYIIPVNDNGAIKGEAVSNPTFEQYQIAVGKVIAIESDGRAKIIVKVA